MSSINTPNKPNIEPEVLSKILEEEYGVHAIGLELLNGYDDLNYMVRDSTDCKLLLKVYNDKFSKSTKEIEGEIDIITYLKKKQFPVPEIIPTKRGSLYFIYVVNSSKQHIIRLQKFIRGRILDKIKITPAICEKLGRLVGQVDKSLGELDKTLLCSSCDKAGREWDLTNISLLRPFIKHIQDPEKLSLIERSVDFAESRLCAAMSELPSQAIHGDVNEQNVIVSDDGEIVGLIDFGDSVFTRRVFEPAIALAYMIMIGTDPRQCAMSFLSGYLQFESLTKLEKSVIFPCIIGRLSQSLLLGNYSAVKLAEEGRSNEYVLITSKEGWKTLGLLMDSPLGTDLADSFERM